MSVLLFPWQLPILLTVPPDEDRYAHPERDRGDRHGRRDRDSRRAPASRDGFQNVPTAPRADREKQPPVATPTSEAAPFVPPMTENDLSAIRSRYLGVDKKKRKIRKMNDRKFVFDWDAQDDTYSEDSPVAVGSNRQGAQIMFGRGHIAGMDDGGRKGSGPHDAHLADARERRRAAKAGFDDRHWTEKPLNEMTERDWRIFREDFSISARGGQIPHPLRSWAESDIPQSILDCIERIGYKEPSPIQRQAIPIGLQNRDIIGIAETGAH